MKQLFCLLFVGFLDGLTFPLEKANSQGLDNSEYRPMMSYCYDTTAGETCFMPFLASNSHLVPFKAANRWCNSTVAGSSLIIINSLESQRNAEIFIGTQVLANETIVIDAQSLSAITSQEWSWVNGHATVPMGGRTEQFPGGGSCVESKDRQTLANCVGHVNPQYRYMCEYSGAADTYTHGDVGQTDASSEKQCICVSPQCSMKNRLGKVEYGRTWWSCHCNQNYAIVCQKEVTDTEEMSPSTPADFTSSPPGITGASDSTSSMATEPLNPESDEQTSVLASPSTEITEDTAPTSPLTQDPTYRASDDKTTVFTSLSLSLSSAAPAAPAASEPSTENERNETLFIIPLLVAVAFIVVAVFLIIRKRKYARRYETSPLNRTDQNEAVPRGYEIMVRDNRPSGDNIYTELEVTQQPTPSNSTTYASIQPASEVVVIGKSVDYVDIDFPLKDQQKPMSADKGTVSVSSIYSQPFEPPTSDSNTDYVEPYKPDVKPTPVQSNQAAADQQNIYSLAKAIPLGDPNVIYSEPNKPAKSSTPTGKEVKVKDPVYLNVIEVKPGAGSGDVATQDPSAVYAEPIKLKKSP